MVASMSKPVILTGLRANNDLHIGNYLGALLPLVDMAREKSGEYEVNLFVPDLHSFTTPIDHSALQAAIRQNLRVFVAAGLPLDNPSVHIYRQSYIPAHSERTWILDCFTGFGEMSRMKQFKDKSAVYGAELQDLVNQHIDTSRPPRPGDVERTNEAVRHRVANIEKARASRVSVGLFNYSVLMAADILLYGAEYVPVGDDQTQHIEFARDIAERLNTRFQRELFTVPRPVKEQHEFFGKDQGLRIRDLQNPAKKMSKSDESGKGVIFLTDSPEAARKKIMSAETDSMGKVAYDYNRQPGVSNLLDIYRFLGGEPREFMDQPQYGPLKAAVADKVEVFLKDFQSRLAAVDEQAIESKLKSDEFIMNEVANTTLFKVQRAVGLRPKPAKPERAGKTDKPQRIGFEHFEAIDIRVGTVIAAEKVVDSDKLLKLRIDMGKEERQILTGMQEFYEPKDFIGKQVPVLVNLAHRTMAGEASEGMLLALEGDAGPVFLLPEKPLPNGSPLE